MLTFLPKIHLPSLLPSNPATKGETIVEQSFNLMKKVTMGSVNDEKSNES